MTDVFTGGRPDLLRLLSTEITHGEQAALLGVAAGLSTAAELEMLPGMAAPGDRRAAVQSLVARGWIRTEAGRLVLSVRDLNPSSATLRAMSRRKKVAAMLAFFSSDEVEYKLAALGLAGMREVLSAVEQKCLLQSVEWVEMYKERDKRRTRRLRKARLAFVDRRVPLEYLDPQAPTRPRRAPRNVRELMLATLLRGCEDQADRASLSDRFDLLYEHLFVEGEDGLAHGWRIIQAIGELDLNTTQRWDETCRRIAARTIRRGLPDVLGSYRAHDPRQLVAMYPVPDCGYGPWVEQELALYWRFSKRYAGAVGRPAVRSLWVQAHRKARTTMMDGERETTDPAWEAEYERKLFAVADEMTASAVGGFADGAVQMWDAYEWRCLFRRVARYAQDYPPGRAPRGKRRTVEDLGAPHRRINLAEKRNQDWAPRLLRLILHRRMGWPVDPDEWNRALSVAREKLRRKRVCKVRRSPAVQARRLWMRYAPTAETGNGNPPSALAVELLVERILEELGFGQERTSPGAKEAHRALEECAHRSGIVLVIVDGPHGSRNPDAVAPSDDPHRISSSGRVAEVRARPSAKVNGTGPREVTPSADSLRRSPCPGAVLVAGAYLDAPDQNGYGGRPGHRAT
jgi:hypothetical protein